MNNYRYVWRIVIVFLGTTLAFGGLVSRLAYLHTNEHESAGEKIARMHSIEKPISVGRGRILDRNGHVFAIDLPACDVWINPSQMKEDSCVMDVATRLAEILDLPVDELYLKIKNSSRREQRIKRYASADVAEAVAEIDRRHAWTRPVIIRDYPHEELLCHALGFVNWQGQPGGGLEQCFNDSLQGSDGLWVAKKDGLRRELYNSRHLEIAPIYGSDVELTIDQNLQYMLENALDDMIEEHNPEAAWALMQNVRTGEILALASRPGFDPNQFRFSGSESRRNRVLSSLYEPGSTFKPFVVAAALNEGVVEPDETFFCENGRWLYGGRYLHDDHSMGELDVCDIVKKSSNIGTAKIALRLGEERLENYLRSYGFGQKTGIELPGEEAGILHSRRDWSAISATRLAMGHEVAVSSLQLLNAVSALVNGGYLMRPHIVRRIVDAEGSTVYQSRPEVLRRVLRSETSATIRRMMATVTEDDGTGRRAQIPGYLVGGKTGTAQKPIPGGYSNTEHISSFVGFLPAEAPAIAIIVVADNPQPHHYGGRVAAPAFKCVAEQAVRYLNIPPSDAVEYASSNKAAQPGSERGRL